MEVGVIIPNAGPKASPENIVATTRLAWRLGYRSVWVTDHVALPEQVDAYYPYRAHGRWDYSPDTSWLDPLLSLSWAAAACPGMKVGTSILVAPLRHPALLAKQIATLDFLTGGGFTLGVGVGWMKEEFEIIGQPFRQRGARAEEMVDLMRRFWRGETVEHAGEFYDIAPCRMYPRPVQTTVPVVWGGHSEFALRRVARMGDGWHPTQITLEQLAGGLARLRDICEQEGRDFDSLVLVARPGDTYEITPETHARHLELGVDRLIVDTPIQEDDPDLSILTGKMERIASICGLEPPPAPCGGDRTAGRGGS